MNKDFSERLKEVREDKGLKPEAFAAIGEVGKSAQYTYEKGERKPDIEYLANIAKIGCDIQYIVTGVRSTQALTEDEQRLLDLFKKGNLQHKMAIMAVAESDANGIVTAKTTPTRSFGKIEQYIEKGDGIYNKNSNDKGRKE